MCVWFRYYAGVGTWLSTRRARASVLPHDQDVSLNKMKCQQIHCLARMGVQDTILLYGRVCKLRLSRRMPLRIVYALHIYNRNAIGEHGVLRICSGVYYLCKKGGISFMNTRSARAGTRTRMLSVTVSTSAHSSSLPMPCPWYSRITVSWSSIRRSLAYSYHEMLPSNTSV